MNETGWKIPDDVQREVDRIRAAQIPGDCDKEDLISYARDVASMRKLCRKFCLRLADLLEKPTTTD